MLVPKHVLNYNFQAKFRKCLNTHNAETMFMYSQNSESLRKKWELQKLIIQELRTEDLFHWDNDTMVAMSLKSNWTEGIHTIILDFRIKELSIFKLLVSIDGC